MGKMTDALKKARMIKEGKLPPTAPVKEPVAEEASETVAAAKSSEQTVETGASPTVLERKSDTETAEPGKGRGPVRHAASVGKKPCTMTALEPAGVSAEEFRALKQKVLVSFRLKKGGAGKKSGSQVILVTGSGPAEGKTTVAANLALALGENADCRVLLVDADLLKPDIGELFGLESDAVGLAEMLLGRASVEEASVATELNNLWVMGAGRARKSLEELMVPKKLQSVLSQMAGVFRYVVVDGPAPTVMRQTAELAPVADAVLLVLKRSRSSKRRAREAVKLIRNRGGEILGCVMVD